MTQELSWQERRELEELEHKEARKSHKDRAFNNAYLNHGKQVKAKPTDGLIPVRIDSKTVVFRKPEYNSFNRA